MRIKNSYTVKHSLTKKNHATVLGVARLGSTDCAKEGEIMSRSLGIPVKLLHEAAGHVVTVELKSGELYRGSMIECEDNWNCQLENITHTAKVPSLLYLSLIFLPVLASYVDRGWGFSFILPFPLPLLLFFI